MISLQYTINGTDQLAEQAKKVSELMTQLQNEITKFNQLKVTMEMKQID